MKTYIIHTCLTYRFGVNACHWKLDVSCSCTEIIWFPPKSTGKLFGVQCAPTPPHKYICELNGTISSYCGWLFLFEEGRIPWMALFITRGKGEWGRFHREFIYLQPPPILYPKPINPFGYKILKELLLGIDLYCLLCQHDFLSTKQSRPGEWPGERAANRKIGHRANHPPFTMIVVSNQLFVFFIVTLTDWDAISIWQRVYPKWSSNKTLLI